MAKSGASVAEVRHIYDTLSTLTSSCPRQFLNELEEKLLPIGIKDREALLAIKKKEHQAKGLPFDGKLYNWDYSYYNHKYVQETLDLDGSLVKEYFPVSFVVPTVLEIYQNLLHVRFEEIKDASVWHPGFRRLSSAWIIF